MFFNIMDICKITIIIIIIIIVKLNSRRLNERGIQYAGKR